MVEEAANEEAAEARPEPKEAVKMEVRGVRIEAPDTRTTLPAMPAGSIGSTGKELGFVLIDITVPGETTRVQDQDTTEI